MMNEQSTATFGLTAAAIAFVGPFFGPYALIAICALCGAMWPLSASSTLGKLEGAWLLLRCTLTALVLTAFLAQLLEQAAGVDAAASLPAIALCIGALGNGWHPVFDALGAALRALLKRVAK